MALAAPAAAELRLSLKDAVEIALSPEGNTRVQLVRELERQAETRSAQARSALLPDISGTISEQNLTRNIAALGVRPQIPIPGFQFPEFVGPFSIFDVRAWASQNIFDLASIRRYQAARTGVELAKAESQSTRNQVIDQVARLYLATLRSEAALETARANVALAERLVKLAGDQKTAGTGTGIEVTRANVQLSNERQRLLVAENERKRVHFQLLKALGLKLETKVELTDHISYAPLDPMTEQKALETARQFRAELQAQRKREESSRLNHSSVKMERVPSLAGFADYGTIGSGLDHALPTRTFGVAVRIPIFDGGRKDARRAESLSQYRQEQIRTRDLEQQVDLEIRLALDSLRSADQQVKTADEGLALAENELAQAQRRYQAGVANSLEVTDAQTRLERARENRILALFNHNSAKIDLNSAIGTIEKLVQP